MKYETTRSRGEIEEQIDKSGREMEERGAELERKSADVETVRDTLQHLETGGTMEGSEAVEVAIGGAEDVAVESFENTDDELETVHAADQEFGGEIEENTETVESNLDRVSESSSKIETEETVNEMVRVKEELLRDEEFLNEQRERAETARNDSEEAQQQFRGRVETGGS